MNSRGRPANNASNGIPSTYPIWPWNKAATESLQLVQCVGPLAVRIRQRTEGAPSASFAPLAAFLAAAFFHCTHFVLLLLNERHPLPPRSTFQVESSRACRVPERYQVSHFVDCRRDAFLYLSRSACVTLCAFAAKPEAPRRRAANSPSGARPAGPGSTRGTCRRRRRCSDSVARCLSLRSALAGQATRQCVE
jgi:hypothetical protein